eukprot:1131117-Amphidinium_carterae.1
MGPLGALAAAFEGHESADLQSEPGDSEAEEASEKQSGETQAYTLNNRSLEQKCRGAHFGGLGSFTVFVIVMEAIAGVEAELEAQVTGPAGLLEEAVLEDRHTSKAKRYAPGARNFLFLSRCTTLMHVTTEDDHDDDGGMHEESEEGDEEFMNEDGEDGCTS